MVAFACIACVALRSIAKIQISITHSMRSKQWPLRCQCLRLPQIRWMLIESGLWSMVNVSLCPYWCTALNVSFRSAQFVLFSCRITPSRSWKSMSGLSHISTVKSPCWYWYTIDSGGQPDCLSAHADRRVHCRFVLSVLLCVHWCVSCYVSIKLTFR